jgi:hypothetical protein
MEQKRLVDILKEYTNYLQVRENLIHIILP